MPLQALRIIDANLNRASEGLRFLEDIARFLLNDAELSQQLKAIRHNLAQEAKSLDVRLLSHRDSEHDVGHPHVPRQIKSGVDEGHPPLPLPSRERERDMEANSLQGLSHLVMANAKRVGESLRVIEELAKLPQVSPMLNSTKFEQLRFNLYSLERRLTAKILRQDKIKQLPGLYVILDRQALAGRDELDAAEQVIHGGARVIQLRDKQGDKGELLSIAQKIKALCGKSGVLFIINDHLDLVVASDADGLHIGQRDLPLPAVRRQLPIDKIVGLSVTTPAQAIKAQKEGADYIAVGSIFPTTTKEGTIVVGLDMVKQIKQAVSCPLVAIGGINEGNIGQVVAAGADSVAVISAVLGKEDIKGAVQQLIARMRLPKKNSGD